MRQPERDGASTRATSSGSYTASGTRDIGTRRVTIVTRAAAALTAWGAGAKLPPHVLQKAVPARLGVVHAGHVFAAAAPEEGLADCCYRGARTQPKDHKQTRQQLLTCGPASCYKVQPPKSTIRCDVHHDAVGSEDVAHTKSTVGARPP